MATQVLNFADYERTDYENMANELADMEVLSQEQALRVQIDSELENALKELESLQTQLPKEQSQKLFEQCAQNALDAVIGHFGLAAAVLDSKDGAMSILHTMSVKAFTQAKKKGKLTKIVASMIRRIITQMKITKR